MSTSPGVQPHDLICFSHLRWNFVFQRPQHLMMRCATKRRVFFVEEPIFDRGAGAHLATTLIDGVRVIVPHLPACDEPTATRMQRRLIDGMCERWQIERFIAWFYTPMALRIADHLRPDAIVYDCMDELSAFANAPAELQEYERKLLRRATLVLTGGQSLYEAKRHAHPNVHAFPSSVDVKHFEQARWLALDLEPPDQAEIPRPRIGFSGVIDERMDLELLAGVAADRRDWHFVLLGPIVKIDPATLPRRSNIHYLGQKDYADLPRYLAGWDVATIPFARNDATRFISPTKTPEYLAAGLPVVSTSIADVVRPYGQNGLARIADDRQAFAAACEAAMHDDASERMRVSDAFLRHTSWDGTWTRISSLLDAAVGNGAHTARTA